MRVDILCCLALALLAGCTRPRVVRSVAESALPIATQLQTSAPALQGRMALQLRGFEERNLDVAREITLVEEPVILAHRLWRLRDDGGRPKRLAFMREGDAAILADPLAPLAAPRAMAAAPNSVALGDLDRSIAGLDSLTRRARLDVGQLFKLGRSVNEELRKIDQEAKGKSKD